MRKTLFSFIIMVVAILSTACSNPMESWNSSMLSDEDVAHQRIENLIEAINDSDKEAIKDMLAKDTIDGVQNIDAQIETLINTCQSSISSYEDPGALEVNRDSEDGNVRLEFEYSYLVYTDEGTYWISIKDTITDDFDITYEGINYIYIKETEGWNEGKPIYWPESEPEIGIHIVEQVNKLSVLDNVMKYGYVTFVK